MKTTTSDGIAIDYDALGPADSAEPALLLMTAWCMSRSGWGDLPQKLADRGLRVLTFDFRGHGASQSPVPDHGAEGLAEDALAVAKAAGAERFIPVTMSHSGWVGVDLRKKLGPDRVPKIVHTDWVVLPPPPEYMQLVGGLADANGWQQARDILFQIWLTGVENPAEIAFVKEEMGGYGEEIWRRSGRVIGACLEAGKSGIDALSTLEPKAETLHVYAQPKDPGYKAAQEQFGQANPWYAIHLLEGAKGHFPALEVADEMADVIAAFVRG